MTVVIKSADHHWWPRGLSKFWAGDDGCVTQLRPNGAEIRLTPDKFGFTTNAHHMRVSKEPSPWNSSMEPSFDRPDSNFPQVAHWLAGLELTPYKAGIDWPERLKLHSISPSMDVMLGECLASLIVRSPASKNRVAATVNFYRESAGISSPADKNLIAANLNGLWEHLSRDMRSGRFIVIGSSSREFLFGDGFLHSFPMMKNPPLSLVAVVPVLPNVTVIYARPMGGWVPQRLVSFEAKSEEVDTLNEIVQVYSKNAIFFRNDRPEIVDGFLQAQFLTYQHNNHPFIESLVNWVVNQRL